MKVGAIVRITWNDSSTDGGRWTRKKKGRVSRIESVGYVTHVSKNKVTVMQSVCVKGPGRGSASSALTIPRACIMESKELD